MVQRLLLLQLLLFASSFVSSMNSPRSSLAVYDFKVSNELVGNLKRPIIEDWISDDKKTYSVEDYDPFFTLGADFDGTLFYMEKSSNLKISLQKTIWELARDTKPFDLSGYSYGFSNLFIIGFIHKNIINAQNIESPNQEDQMLFERDDFSIVSLEKSSGEYKWNITYSQYTSKEENSYCFYTIDRKKISDTWNFKLDIKEENSLKQRLFEYFKHHLSNYYNPSKAFQIFCSVLCDLIELCNDNLGILAMIILAASLGFLLGRKSQISSCPSSRSSSEDPIDCQIKPHFPNLSDSFTEGVLPIIIPETENVELLKLKFSVESISPIAKTHVSAPEKNYFEFNRKIITPFEINKEILNSPIEMEANYKHKAILTLREFENLTDSDMEISQDPIKEIKKSIIEDESSSEDELGVKEYWDSPQRSKKRISVTRLPQKNGEFKELIDVLDDGNYNRKFEFQNILGYGGFSSVHLAKHKLDGQLYAIKIVKMKIGISQSITRHRLFAEVNLLKKLHSKYLVQYITCWAERELNKIQEEDEGSDSSRYALSSDMSSEISSFLDEKYMSVLLHIQMEYCSGMSLQGFLENDKRVIDRKVNYNILTQILKGIKHIHDKGIIHRDLKPANIFLDGGNNVKIGDFNLATALEQSEKSSQSYLDMQELSSNIGTPLYLAPEQEHTHKYNHKADIFPIGIILLELYFKFGTFHEKISILKKIRECGEIPEGFKKDYPIESELVRLMTSLNPKNRPNARELLNCQLLKSWKSELKI